MSWGGKEGNILGRGGGRAAEQKPGSKTGASWSQRELFVSTSQQLSPLYSLYSNLPTTKQGLCIQTNPNLETLSHAEPCYTRAGM